MDRLRGQVAVVTGASSGVGKSTALALAKEGASVALVARRADVLEQLAGEIKSLGVDALPYPADVSDPQAMEAMASAVLERFGRVDSLVYSAGVLFPQRGMDDITIENWQSIVNVHLNGLFYCTKAILSAMRAQRRGTVVIISSYAGVRTSLMGGPAYSAAKTAAISFNESINLAERKNGIRACVICPGEINTPILKQRPVPLTEAELATMLLPEDVAEAVLFAVTQPQRATVEQIIIRPTVIRAGYGKTKS
jgi:NADP-dependent 3-hydroxy acid dehydrogenase YdfG